MTNREQAPPEGATPLDALAAWVLAYRQAKSRIAELTEIADQAKAHITEAMGESETGTIDGAPVVRWAHVTSKRLDQKALKADHPNIAKAYTKTTESRRFTLTEPPEASP